MPFDYSKPKIAFTVKEGGVMPVKERGKPTVHVFPAEKAQEFETAALDYQMRFHLTEAAASGAIIPAKVGA